METAAARRDKALAPLVEEAFLHSRGTYGKTRIRAALQRKDVQVSERKVSQIMVSLGLVSTRTTYRFIKEPHQPIYLVNKLGKKFDIPEPNLVWVADCTFIRGPGRWFFLCAIVDLFARRVVGWNVSDSKDAELVTITLKRAFFERGQPRRLLFHSDQGPEFTEYLLRQWELAQGMTPSFSKPGTPHDNATAESFFATLKQEEVLKKSYASLEELYDKMAGYVSFYNNERLHTSLGCRTPREVEDEFFFGGGDKILD